MNARKNATEAAKEYFYIGREFKFACGTFVKIVDYDTAKKITVQCSDGDTRVVQGASLREGKLSWAKTQVYELELGSKITLRCGTVVTLVEIHSGYHCVVEDQDGCRKTTRRSRLRKGAATWHGLTTNSTLPPIMAETEDGDSSESYYVYFVWHNDEIVYIGKGCKNRYRHANSGRSHNYDLNRLHFSGEVMAVTFYKTGLSEQESLEEEVSQIKLYSPTFNNPPVAWKTLGKLAPVAPSELDFA